MLGTELKRIQSVKCEVPIHFLRAKTSAGTKPWIKFNIYLTLN